MAKPVCPICGANLIYERIDDGTSVVEITGANSINEIACNSDGSTRVYCSADESHDIDNGTWDMVVLIAEDFGY
jgi:hypothetical protein